MKPNQKLCASVCSLIAETKKDGFIDVTQSYNKIVVSIEQAEEAAKMASEATNSTLEVKKKPKITSLSFEVTLKTETESVLVLFSEREGPEPRSEGGVSEEPQHGSEG